MDRPSISVVIPALNESLAIADVIKGLRSALRGHAGEVEIVVVDDGSTDGTGEAAREQQATVVRHPVNKGYGQALQTGIAKAKHDWILMIDADGSYPTSEIPKLLEFIPDCDLVIGMRTGTHFWGTPFSAFLRWTYLKIASFVVGEKIPDANSGLRIVRKSLAAKDSPVQCYGYSHSTTMTLSFLKAGHFVKFVPIAFHERKGHSKVKFTRDMLRTLQIMTQILIVYNPLKLFVTLGLIPAIAAAALFANYFCRHNTALLILSALAAIAALQCFLVGCLLDSIRMNRV